MSSSFAERQQYRLDRDLIRHAAANLNTEAEYLTTNLQLIKQSGRLHRRVVERRATCWRAAQLLEKIASGDY